MTVHPQNDISSAEWQFMVWWHTEVYTDAQMWQDNQLHHNAIHFTDAYIEMALLHKFLIICINLESHAQIWKHMHNLGIVHINQHKLKARIALNRIPITEHWDVTCHMGSQCHLLPNTSELTRDISSPQVVLHLPALQAWKAELI